MIKITAGIEKTLYRIEIKSPTGNIVIADEPIDKGGQDKGLSPRELLAASLGSCTCATLRIYADNKGWDLQNIHVTIEMKEDIGKTFFERSIKLTGDLDETKRTRLLKVADACPVHKILSGYISIDTVTE